MELKMKLRAAAHIYTVFKKRGVEFFAITSSAVNRFENSFTIGNNNELSIKSL